MTTIMPHEPTTDGPRNPRRSGAEPKPRTRGLGSTYERRGIWWIKFYVPGSRKPVRESSRSRSRADALRLLKRRIAEVEGGRFAPAAEKVTVGDLFTMLIADYRAKRNKSDPKLTHLCAWFGVAVKDGAYSGGWRAAAVTTDRVRQYEADRLDAGAARATVNQELAMLRRAFNLAVEAGRLAAKPRIKTPDPRNARKGFVTERQFEAVRDALPETLRGAWAFCYLTGWRVGEVLPLTWAQVDWRRGVVRLDDSKNGEPREFPFADYAPLRAVLAAAKASAQGPHVFHDGRGQPVRYERYNDARRRACAAVGVAAITHDLRRTAVRNLEAAGVSRSVAMKLTGHKTEAVYRRYAIVDSVAQREGVAKLAAFHAGRGDAAGTATGTIAAEAVA